MGIHKRTHIYLLCQFCPQRRGYVPAPGLSLLRCWSPGSGYLPDATSGSQPVAVWQKNKIRSIFIRLYLAHLKTLTHKTHSKLVYNYFYWQVPDQENGGYSQRSHVPEISTACLSVLHNYVNIISTSVSLRQSSCTLLFLFIKETPVLIVWEEQLKTTSLKLATAVPKIIQLAQIKWENKYYTCFSSKCITQDVVMW